MTCTFQSSFKEARAFSTATGAIRVAIGVASRQERAARRPLGHSSQRTRPTRSKIMLISTAMSAVTTTMATAAAVPSPRNHRSIFQTLESLSAGGRCPFRFHCSSSRSANCCGEMSEMVNSIEITRECANRRGLLRALRRRTAPLLITTFSGLGSDKDQILEGFFSDRVLRISSIGGIPKGRRDDLTTVLVGRDRYTRSFNHNLSPWLKSEPGESDASPDVGLAFQNKPRESNL